MTDSSDDEDLSRFSDVIDTSFTKLINESRGRTYGNTYVDGQEKPKSLRYLEEASHYNDVKVPEEMQKQLWAKASAVIRKQIVFIDTDHEIKKRKIKGGVKLFKCSDGFLSCEAVIDTYTENHNNESKKINKKKRRQIDVEDQDMNEKDKIMVAAVSGDYIMSREETKCWKSRRKEKLYKY